MPGGALVAAALAGVALALPAPAAASPCAGASSRPAVASRHDLAAATLCLLNEQRVRHGLRRLAANPRLSKAARGHAVDMARRNYFSHSSLSGATFLDRIRRSGYLRRARSWSAGENIAWGSGPLGTPRAIVRAWMRSPGHRANILNRRFRHIGLGVALDTPVRGLRGATYVHTFGSRR